MSSNSSAGAIITCDSSGKVSRTTFRRQSEEWYIVDHHGGVLIINCANDKYLVSDADGTVTAASPNEGPSDGQEVWIIAKEESPSSNSNISTNTSQESYMISSAMSGRYLTCDKVNGNICTFPQPQSVSGRSDDSPISKGTPGIVRNSPNLQIEFLSGELCFISSPWADKQLSYNSWSFAGNPCLYGTWTGSEVWRFIEAGDGHVRIMRMNDKLMLSSDADGKVSTTHDSSLGHNGSKWSVERAPEDQGVIIKSVLHKRYLQVESDGTISASERLQGRPSIWQISAASRQKFFLSSPAHNKKIGHEKGGNLDCTGTDNCGESEVWEVEYYQENACVSLKSTTTSNKQGHGTACKFLNSDQNGNLYETDTLGDNGLWRLEQSTTNCIDIAIVSNASGRYLSCREKDHHLFTPFAEEIGKNETWNLIPILPGTIPSRGKKYLSMMGGPVIGMAVAPPLLLGGVAIIGFGSAGIAGGSIAAWMMSLGGGATATGGVVATLQSIGAVGMGAVGTGGTMLAGGAIGEAGAKTIRGRKTVQSSIHGGMVATRGNTSNTFTIEAQHQRPFCDWQSWKR